VAIGASETSLYRALLARYYTYCYSLFCFTILVCEGVDNMASQLTWGQMKEKFKDAPDNALIVAHTHNSMEMGNATVNAYASQRKMVLERRDFVDAFDYTRYSSDVYTSAKEDDKDAVDVI
jgi:hypothetical protein